MYHWEADQEDFLVLMGEALLIIEGEERPLRQWDFVHCPPEAKHTIVGAGDSTSLVLAVGARDKTAARTGAATASTRRRSATAPASSRRRAIPRRRTRAIPHATPSASATAGSRASAPSSQAFRAAARSPASRPRGRVVSRSGAQGIDRPARRDRRAVRRGRRGGRAPHPLAARTGEQAGRPDRLRLLVRDRDLHRDLRARRGGDHLLAHRRSARGPTTTPTAPPIHGHTGLEIVWTAIPACSSPRSRSSARSCSPRTTTPATDHAERSNVTAQQFAWSFKYPDYGNVDLGDAPAPGRPAGRARDAPSLDVIHSFWVPEFGQKQDAVPGQRHAAS